MGDVNSQSDRPIRGDSTDAPRASVQPQTLKSVTRQVWHTARSDERRIFQIVTALACFLANILVGVFYRDSILFQGWQAVIWMVSIVFLFVELTPKRKVSLQPDRSWLIIGGIVLAGFLFRAFGLDMLPPGFHVDEAGMVDFTLRHVFPNPSMTINPFITGSNSHPTLYNYILRLFMGVFGYTIAGVKLSSAVAGTLAIFATYFMVKEFSGQRAGLIAALVIATYNVHIHWSRIALNNIWATLWVPLALGLFVWGWRIKWSGGGLLSGLALGLTAYFYSGGYIVILLMLYLIVKIWQETEQKPGFVIYTGKMLVLALCTAIPLVIFALFHRDLFFARTNELYVWKPEAIQMFMGDKVNYAAFFWKQFSGAFGLYNIIPEQSGFYASQVPLLLGFSSILFLVGIGWAFYKKLFLPILWILCVTILGGFLVAPPPSSQHYIVAIPAICWLVAIPIDWMFELRRRTWAITLLSLVVIVDLAFYFYIYYSAPGRDLFLPFPPLP